MPYKVQLMSSSYTVIEVFIRHLNSQAAFMCSESYINVEITGLMAADQIKKKITKSKQNNVSGPYLRKHLVLS